MISPTPHSPATFQHRRCPLRAYLENTMPALTARARATAAAMTAAGALLLGAAGCKPSAPAAQPAPAQTTTQSATQAAAPSPSVVASTTHPAPTATASTPAAPSYEFGNGTVYDAWITSVTPGSPAHVTMEMAWHYTGKAAVAYAKAHGLPAPLDDHIDVDRGFSATVAASPSLQATINPLGAGVHPLSPAAFLAWAAKHPAVKYSGQYGGPIYAVTFTNDVLVTANEIFEP